MYIPVCDRPSVRYEDIENILTIAALAHSTLCECKYQLRKVDDVFGTNKTPGDIDDMIRALDGAINAIDETYSPKVSQEQDTYECNACGQTCNLAEHDKTNGENLCNSCYIEYGSSRRFFEFQYDSMIEDMEECEEHTLEYDDGS